MGAAPSRRRPGRGPQPRAAARAVHPGQVLSRVARDPALGQVLRELPRRRPGRVRDPAGRGRHDVDAGAHHDRGHRDRRGAGALLVLPVTVERPQLVRAVVGHAGSLAVVQNHRVEMVLEIAADARQIVQRLDADRLQVIGGADTRQQEKLRRVHRAATQNDLAIGARDLVAAVDHVAHAHGPVLVEDDAFDLDLAPSDPVSAVRAVSHDISLGRAYECRDGRTRTALGVQEEILSGVTAWFGRQDDDPLGGEGAAVLEEWSRTLENKEGSNLWALQPGLLRQS
mgnify:CR=1 FL=1